MPRILRGCKRGRDSFIFSRHHTEPQTKRHRQLLLELLDDWAKPELCIALRVGSEVLRLATVEAKARGYVGYDGPREVSDR